MQQSKKPTNAQYKKLILKIQSKLFGISDTDVLKFDEICENGNPLHFYNCAPLYKSLFIEDVGVTLIYTLNNAIVRRNFCDTIFNSHVSDGESAPYVLIGLTIDIFTKYECVSLVSLLQKESELEQSERIIIDCFVMWVNAMTNPQFECGLSGNTKRENINSHSRLQLLFDCAMTCNEVFLNNEKDLTLHEFYHEFIKQMRVKSLTYKNVDNCEEVNKIEDEAYDKIKSRILENGNELNQYIAIITPKFEGDEIEIPDIQVD